MSENVEVRRPTAWDELFPNRFLKAGLMKGKDATLTIRDVTMEDLPDDKGNEKPRALMMFEETPKVLGLNKTNALCLKAMFGSNVREWIGKRVTLYPTQDRFGKDIVDAIRVRGSPDIAADIAVEIKHPKKAPKRVLLTKMVSKPRVDSSSAAPIRPVEHLPPPVE